MKKTYNVEYLFEDKTSVGGLTATVTKFAAVNGFGIAQSNGTLGVLGEDGVPVAIFFSPVSAIQYNKTVVDGKQVNSNGAY